MNPMILNIGGALLFSLSPLVNAPAPGIVKVGDVPTFTFKRPLLNGMDTKSLKDLRGKPVYIEFWGRGAAALDDSMKEALAMQEAYGDDLTVIFAETQKATDNQVASLALKKKWLGGRAMWTTEQPCRTGLEGAYPQFILLSSEGAVLLKGTTRQMELGYRNELVEQLEDSLRSQVKLRRKGPEGTPSALVPAWKAFAGGKIGKAFQLARAAAAKAEEDPLLEGAAIHALGTFTARVERRLARTAWQIEWGYLYQAEEELSRLEGELGSETALESRHSQLAANLHSDSMKAEWKAAKELAKLEKTMYAKGSRAITTKQLAKLAKKHTGTKAAARAQQWHDAAETSAY